MKLRRPLLTAAALIALVTVTGCSAPSQNDDGAAQSSEGPSIDSAALLGDNPGTLSPSTDNPVTLVEFADYQCPPCGMVSSTITDIAEQYPDDVSVIIRNYPLTEIHPNAEAAAYAAEAARVQGQFPAMYKALFDNQESWSALEGADAEDAFEEYADEIGLDVEQFNADRTDSAVIDTVEADVADGNEIGVASTPTLVLNGELLQISSLDDITQAVEAAVDAQ